MSKHTPGPWHHTGREFNDVRDSDDELVAVALHLRVGQPERSVQEAEANARLIAAAPELLEALKTAMQQLETDAIFMSLSGANGDHQAKAALIARAAIAKATGETNDQN